MVCDSSGCMRQQCSGSSDEQGLTLVHVQHRQGAPATQQQAVLGRSACATGGGGQARPGGCSSGHRLSQAALWHADQRDGLPHCAGIKISGMQALHHPLASYVMATKAACSTITEHHG